MGHRVPLSHKSEIIMKVAHSSSKCVNYKKWLTFLEEISGVQKLKNSQLSVVKDKLKPFDDFKIKQKSIQ